MTQTLQHSLPEHLIARRSAQRREWAVQWIAGALATVCLFSAGFLLTPINVIRKERQLVIDPETIGTLPPDIELLGKLGTFRALAIVWASIRAERLKEQGKVYEAMQLHNTVCALAPRFPNVWAYAAWNMAYNISVSQYTPEARWQWVRNGIELLRDRGLVYNPKSVTLYKELAWIYWHKIGDFLDDEHLNYKRALAVDMERVLGAPIVAITEEEYFDWFRKIVDAPRDLDGFLEDDSQVALLVDELRELDLHPDIMLLEFVARHIRPELMAAQLLKDAPKADTPKSRRLELLTAENNIEPVDRLLAAVRSKILRERYRFDLDWMLDLMVNQYGPLDWRNAFAHSLYWSSWGDHYTEGQIGGSRADAMNTARFVFFSLQNLTTRGKMTLWPDFDDPFSSYLELTPDTRYIPYIYETYLRLGKKHFGDDPRFVEGTAGPNYAKGMVTNAHNWIELLYLEGGEENLEQAENYLAWLRKTNPHPDGSTQERYLVTLDEFVMGDLLTQLQTFRAAKGIIGSFIRKSLKNFALGLTEQGRASFIHAVQSYEYWMEDTKIDFNDRRKLQPPLLQLRDQIESFMKVPQYATLAKARLWNNLPLQQRQMTYDRLLPLFERLCSGQQPPWSRQRAFPEPAGMEEARKRSYDFRGKRREDVEQGERYKK